MDDANVHPNVTATMVSMSNVLLDQSSSQLCLLLSIGNHLLRCPVR
jgi:hypothetical protein